MDTSKQVPEYTTKLRLVLTGYLTPSPNRLYGRHWSLFLKERRRARAALLCALQATDADSATRTIASQAAKRLLTNSVTRD
jgi:hypothetical protein